MKGTLHGVDTIELDLYAYEGEMARQEWLLAALMCSKGYLRKEGFQALLERDQDAVPAIRVDGFLRSLVLSKSEVVMVHKDCNESISYVSWLALPKKQRDDYVLQARFKQTVARLYILSEDDYSRESEYNRFRDAWTAIMEMVCKVKPTNADPAEQQLQNVILQSEPVNDKIIALCGELPTTTDIAALLAEGRDKYDVFALSIYAIQNKVTELVRSMEGVLNQNSKLKVAPVTGKARTRIEILHAMLMEREFQADADSLLRASQRPGISESALLQLYGAQEHIKVMLDDVEAIYEKEQAEAKRAAEAASQSDDDSEETEEEKTPLFPELSAEERFMAPQVVVRDLMIISKKGGIDVPIEAMQKAGMQFEGTCNIYQWIDMLDNEGLYEPGTGLFEMFINDAQYAYKQYQESLEKGSGEPTEEGEA